MSSPLVVEHLDVVEQRHRGLVATVDVLAEFELHGDRPGDLDGTLDRSAAVAAERFNAVRVRVPRGTPQHGGHPRRRASGREGRGASGNTRVAVRCGVAYSSSWSLKTMSSSVNFFLIVTSPTSVMNSTSLSSSTMASSLGKR